MKNRKAYAIVCWVLSAGFCLSALLMSEGKFEDLNKQVIFWLVIGVVWLFLGVVLWIKRNNKNTNGKQK